MYTYRAALPLPSPNVFAANLDVGSISGISKRSITRVYIPPSLHLLARGPDAVSAIDR